MNLSQQPWFGSKVKSQFWLYMSQLHVNYFLSSTMVECWEIRDCKVRSYLTAVQFTHLRVKCMQSFGLHSRNISHLPCGAAKYNHLHWTVYICTVFTHKHTHPVFRYCPTTSFVLSSAYPAFPQNSNNLPLSRTGILAVSMTGNSECSCNTLNTYLCRNPAIFSF